MNQNIFRSCACALALALLCACQTQQTITQSDTSQTVLKQGSLVYVAVPEKPGRDDERSYEGSDYQTAEACAKAFKQYAEVTLGRESQNLENALASARARKCDYMVKPEIRIWEDNPTEWNGERDRLEVDVETFETATGKTISRVVLKGKSRLMTFGDRPERMLIGFFEPHAAKLFGVKLSSAPGK
ncbi:MAG: hypothetical protein JWM99_1228 [Verrucomicrobiales bacterium]|nr:hypothetical protein [Verrucomicrobiales bacterium]